MDHSKGTRNRFHLHLSDNNLHFDKDLRDMGFLNIEREQCHKWDMEMVIMGIILDLQIQFHFWNKKSYIIFIMINPFSFKEFWTNGM